VKDFEDGVDAFFPVRLHGADFTQGVAGYASSGVFQITRVMFCRLGAKQPTSRRPTDV